MRYIGISKREIEPETRDLKTARINENMKYENFQSRIIDI